MGARVMIHETWYKDLASSDKGVRELKAGRTGTARLRMIGRMRAKHLEELEKQIHESGPAITLDGEEVTLVVVRFLGTCEARGATLNCKLGRPSTIAVMSPSGLPRKHF